jgi:hypothetical protein
MKNPKRTRAERERLGRQFAEWMMLPIISRAAGDAGLQGDARLSAALGEIETISDLHHLLGKSRWPRARRSA